MDPGDKDGRKTMQTWFQVDVELPAEDRRVHIGGRAYIRFDLGWEPIGCSGIAAPANCSCRASMFDLSLASASVSSAYPEQKRARPGFSIVSRIVRPARSFVAARPGAPTSNLAERVAKHGADLQRLGAAQLQKAADACASSCARRLRNGAPWLAASRWCVKWPGARSACATSTVQLIGGWIMLNGMIAEMETGEGKTLTATLPAGTAALAGIPVHVITVNDTYARAMPRSMGRSTGRSACRSASSCMARTRSRGAPPTPAT